MWVRSQEIRFDVERTDAVIEHLRDTAIARYNGHHDQGPRLLLDRPRGTALEVSYWSSLAAARSAADVPLAESPPHLDIDVLRTDEYELSIDAC